MKKPSVLARIGFLTVVFAALHIVALKFSIYYTVPFSDWAMHLFGGVLGALMVLYALQSLGLSPRSLPKKIFLMLFVSMCVFCVAMVWELWEVYAGFSDPFDPATRWVFDTLVDLVMGVAGSVVGFIYYDKKYRIHAE